MQSVTHRAHWHSGRVSKKHGGMSGNAFLSSASGGGLHLVENSCAPFPFQPKGIRGRQYSWRCNLTCLLQWKTIKPWFQFLSVSFGQYIIDAETLQKWSELLNQNIRPWYMERMALQPDVRLVTPSYTRRTAACETKAENPFTVHQSLTKWPHSNSILTKGLLWQKVYYC